MIGVNRLHHLLVNVVVIPISTNQSFVAGEMAVALAAALAAALALVGALVGALVVLQVVVLVVTLAVAQAVGPQHLHIHHIPIPKDAKNAKHHTHFHRLHH